MIKAHLIERVSGMNRSRWLPTNRILVSEHKDPIFLYEGYNREALEYTVHKTEDEIYLLVSDYRKWSLHIPHYRFQDVEEFLKAHYKGEEEK